jgi:putative multiple sugar transport system ATP-binding protein
MLLEMRAIRKTFPGVVALDRVDLRVRAGEIHAVVGENGAGKSTLMKVLSGVYPHGSYEGEIHFAGEQRRFRGIADSEAAGIIIIHQELALVPQLSIAENVFLGNETARGGIIDWFEAHARTRELLRKVGLREPSTARVGDLGVGKQQLVEIAKALAKDVKLLILDEPTASLNEADSDALLKLLLELKAHGVTSILISHKLNEVRQVADRVTVLRDGATVQDFDCAVDGLSEDAVIRAMVGREMADRYPPRTPAVGDVLFEVRGWRVRHPLHPEREFIRGVDLQVRRGEIVGISGLMGAGRTEFAMSVFGRSWGRHAGGELWMEGERIEARSVDQALAAGIAYATEDRKGLGLVLGEDIRFNTTLANLSAVARGGVLSDLEEHRVASGYRRRLRIRSSGVHQACVNLSGGNQQKVVLAKCLFAQPRLLILDEPTRGIDVGAKYEIYTVMNELAREGKGILMISSEMPELLGMCDRIYVMNEGRFVAQLARAEASQEAILRAIVGAGTDVQREVAHA